MSGLCSLFHIIKLCVRMHNHCIRGLERFFSRFLCIFACFDAYEQVFHAFFLPVTKFLSQVQAYKAHFSAMVGIGSQRTLVKLITHFTMTVGQYLIGGATCQTAIA